MSDPDDEKATPQIRPDTPADGNEPHISDPHNGDQDAADEDATDEDDAPRADGTQNV